MKKKPPKIFCIGFIPSFQLVHILINFKWFRLSEYPLAFFHTSYLKAVSEYNDDISMAF